MIREAERAIEWDCAQVLTRFAPDGVWHRQGGRAAILAALAERSTTQRVRHVVTKLFSA
jgi:hypothetical protein